MISRKKKCNLPKKRPSGTKWVMEEGLKRFDLRCEGREGKRREGKGKLWGESKICLSSDDSNNNQGNYIPLWTRTNKMKRDVIVQYVCDVCNNLSAGRQQLCL